MDEYGYKTWAAERLLRLIELEDDRRKSVEAKATFGSTTLVAILGAISSVVVPYPVEWSFPWMLLLCGYLSILGTFVYAFRAVVASSVGDVDYRQFVAEDVLAMPPEERLDEIISHLVMVQEDIESSANRKGRYANRAQQWAMAGAAVFLFTLALRALG